MAKPASIKPIAGHAPKIVTSADVTAGIFTGGYGATLYMVSFGALDTTLAYTLEDSDDNSQWATWTGTLNGVTGQTLTINGVANTSVSLLVRHDATRKYHRLLPAEGANDNYGCVIPLLLQPDQELGTGIDYTAGG